MAWNSWEVFDPFDGSPIHVTDCAVASQQIKQDTPGLDYAPKGMEAGTDGWIPWEGK